ncbi:hypothetical protein LTS18_001594, partial [Coniosporium uncinatum]
TYVPIGANVVNSLIKDVFIEERSASAKSEGQGPKPTYRKDGYTLKWTTAKDLGLMFVAVYQSLLHLSWIDELLDNIRALFTGIYGVQLKKSSPTTLDTAKFDHYFDQQVQKLEKSGETVRSLRLEDSTSDIQLTPSSSGNSEADPDVDEPPAEPSMPSLRKQLHKPTLSDTTSADATPTLTPDASRPSSPAVNNHLLTAKNLGPGGRTSRRARKAASNTTSAAASSGDESPARRGGKNAKSGTKKMRRWDADGLADEDDGTTLDYSASSIGETDPPKADVEDVAQESWGKKTGKGEFILKDLDEEMDNIIAESRSNDTSNSAVASSGILNTGMS